MKPQTKSGLSVGGNKLQTKTKPGYEPSVKGTQKRRAIPAETKAAPKSKIAPSAIINSSELEQLRNYNKQMQQQRDDELRGNVASLVKANEQAAAPPSPPKPRRDNPSQDEGIGGLLDRDPHAASLSGGGPIIATNIPAAEESITGLMGQQPQSSAYVPSQQTQVTRQPQSDYQQGAPPQSFLQTPQSSYQQQHTNSMGHTQTHHYHQHAIIGSQNNQGHQPQSSFNQDPRSEKELRQKKFAEELQAQIRERDEARFKDQIRNRKKLPSFAYDQNEEFPKPNATSHMRSPYRPGAQEAAGPNPSQNDYNNNPHNVGGGLGSAPQQSHYDQPNHQHQQQQPNQAPPSNYNDYQPAQQPQLHAVQQQQSLDRPQNDQTPYSPSQTKQDFPQIMTRGRVEKGRLDRDLEKYSIFAGRDEKNVIEMRREQQKREMQIDLQKQIEEKNRMKELKKQKEQMEELRLEQKVKDEVNRANQEYALSKGIEVSKIAGRAPGNMDTINQNHHSLNIIGSHTGTMNQYQSPGDANSSHLKASQIGSEPNHPPPAPGGGFGKVQNSPIKQVSHKHETIVASHPPEQESLAGLMAKGGQSSPGPVKVINGQSEEGLPSTLHQQPQQVDPRDNEISELSNMVKNLLSEQERLKTQVAAQSTQLSSFQRAKEDQELAPQKHQSASVRQNQIKRRPSENLTKKNLIKGREGSAAGKDNAKLAAERRKAAAQAQEQAKLDAIEAKIEKARQRMEEKKKQKSQVARDTRINVVPKPPNSNLPPRSRKAAQSRNDDLDLIMRNSETTDHYKESLNNGRRRSTVQKKNADGISQKSTLMNAGMNASRKRLESESNMQAHQTSQHDGSSPQKNLDIEGTSQMTFPNQHGSQFMPREQALELSKQIDFNYQNSAPVNDRGQVSSTQYDGIYFDQRANIPQPNLQSSLLMPGLSQSAQYQQRTSYSNHPGMSQQPPPGYNNQPLQMQQYRSIQSSGQPNMAQMQQMRQEIGTPYNGNANMMAQQNSTDMPMWLANGENPNNSGIQDYSRASNPGMSPMINQNQMKMGFATSYNPNASQNMMNGSAQGGMYGHQPQPPVNQMRSDYESFEQEFMMPPDISSIDSDINKISALTPFSDQFMPHVPQRLAPQQHFASTEQISNYNGMQSSGYNPTGMVMNQQQMPSGYMDSSLQHTSQQIQQQNSYYQPQQMYDQNQNQL